MSNTSQHSSGRNCCKPNCSSCHHDHDHRDDRRDDHRHDRRDDFRDDRCHDCRDNRRHW